MLEKRSYMAMDLVRHEIQETLTQAVKDLDLFLLDREDLTKVRFALAYMHQVVGSLVIIESHAASIFAKEIEDTIQKILIGAIEQNEIYGVVDIVKLSVNGLSRYIDLLLDHGQDDIRVLLTDLNKLRQINETREEPFTEADLFSPKLNIDKPNNHKKNLEIKNFNQIIRNLRTHFQRALINLLKDIDKEKNLIVILKVTKALSQSSLKTESESFWQAASQLLNYLHSQSKQVSEIERKALSSIEQQVKQLEDLGAKGFLMPINEAHFKYVLYAIGIQEESTPELDQVIVQYALKEALDKQKHNLKEIKPKSSEFQSSLNQAKAKLVDIKSAFVQFVESNWDKSTIKEVPAMLASLGEQVDETYFLTLPTIAERLAAIVKCCIKKDSQFDNTLVIEPLADIIAAMDYFLECLEKEDKQNLFSILANTDKQLEYLETLIPKSADIIGIGLSEESSTSVINVSEEIEPPVGLQPSGFSLPEGVDEDILDIFIEEAIEVTEALKKSLVILQNNPDDTAILEDVRRGWHTLKGSGRMVGLVQMGEFAYHFEKCFSRYSTGQEQLDAKSLEFVMKATQQVEVVVRALQAQEYFDFTILDQFLDSNEDFIDIDPELLTIFIQEAETHVNVFSHFLETLLNKETPQIVTNEIQRALHTLKGSAHMAEVTAISSMASPLEAFVKSLYNFEVPIDEAISQVFIDAEEGLKTTLLDLGQHKPVNQNRIDDLISSIESLHAEYIQDSKSQDNFYDTLLQGAMTELAQLAELVDLAREGVLSEEQYHQILTALRSLFILSHREQTQDIQNIIVCLYRLFLHWPYQIGGFNQIEQPINQGFTLLDDLFDQFAAHQPVELAQNLWIVLSDSVQEQIALTNMNDTASGFDLLSVADKAQAVNSLSNILDSLNLISLELKEWQYKLDQSSFSQLKQAIQNTLLVTENSAYAQINSTLSFMLKGLNKSSLQDEMNVDAILDIWLQFYECTLVCFLIKQRDSQAIVNVEPSDKLVLEQHAVKEVNEQDSSIVLIDWKQSALQCQQADPETLSFFIEEGTEIINALDHLVHDPKAPEEPIGICKEIKRLLHTLKGGARLTELMILGDLTHQFESVIEVAEYEKSFTRLFEVDVLHYFSLLQKAFDIILNGGEIDEQLANEAVKLSTAEVSVDVININIDISHLDQETLVLFIEEASDQIDEIDAAIALFIKNEDHQQVSSLKRLLHTLKGGARLAEVESIANLSHNFETFIIQSENKGLINTESFLDQTQQYHEQLQQFLTQIKSANENKEAQPDQAEIAITNNASNASVEATKQFFKKLTQKKTNQQKEPIKVSAPLIDKLVNLAGETSINRSRLDEQLSDIVFSMDDMSSTIDRLHNQLRRLEIETEAQIIFRQEQVVSEGQDNFDPLEMDRYTHMQQLSKSLVESASDLDDISDTFNEKLRDLETLLIQQARLNSELQEGLMSAQMVPFSRMVPRLRRIVRQTSEALGKQVQFEVINPEGELDRTILEKVISPLEHMLRNAVDHGIELPEVRNKKGKTVKGKITLSVIREGGEIILRLKDDGAGINVQAVREKAKEQGLINDTNVLTDKEVIQFILHAGFSTAQQVTQISGRGVGMDVVYSEIKQIGGSVEIDSSHRGSQFTVRLPFTVSVNRALMVNVGKDIYAIPLTSIEGIVRVNGNSLNYTGDQAHFDYGDNTYQLVYLGALLNTKQRVSEQRTGQVIPVVLIKGQDKLYAIEIDSIIGSQEIVVKSLGPQFEMVNGLGGATVLGDGRVVVILDMQSLIRADFKQFNSAEEKTEETRYVPEQEDLSILVVDDSVTVRKVTSRLLERHQMKVTLAKDGLDAMNQLQAMDALPDIILLDIEMPRMDGFEVVSRVKHSDRLKQISVCMITSRTGQKHRERALSLGANAYLGKPFQERELLDTIHQLTTEALTS